MDEKEKRNKINELSNNITEIHHLLINGDLTLEKAINIYHLIENCKQIIFQLKDHICSIDFNSLKEEFIKILPEIFLLSMVTSLTPIVGTFIYFIWFFKKSQEIKPEKSKVFTKYEEELRIFSFKKELFRKKLLRLATLNLVDVLQNYNEEEIACLSQIAYDANALICSYIDGIDYEMPDEGTIKMAKLILQNDLKIISDDLLELLEAAKQKVNSQEIKRNRIKPN